MPEASPKSIKTALSEELKKGSHPRGEDGFLRHNLGNKPKATNTYANATHVDERFRTPTYNHPFMTYSEVLFYQAEMAARGLTGGDAESLLIDAITKNMEEWSSQGGEPISQSEIDAYIAQLDYSPAEWKETLGMEMWIAFYNRGYEAWTTWRRLDHPTLNVPPVGGLTAADLPVRFFYPIVEQTANGAAYSQAAAAIGGNCMELTMHAELLAIQKSNYENWTI